jgi:hypothetical protein
MQKIVMPEKICFRGVGHHTTKIFKVHPKVRKKFSSPLNKFEAVEKVSVFSILFLIFSEWPSAVTRGTLLTAILLKMLPILKNYTRFE